tara:strand:- start:31 stop:615 length:585 start_codon:yes stop_codon:yes gene_type:complete
METIQYKINNLFKDFSFINEKLLIFKGILPNSILSEITLFVEESRKYKDHNLGFLKHMTNAGNNEFQCFIPSSLVNSSLFYSYLYYLGNEYISKFKNSSQEVKLVKKYYHSYDNYDLWVNFSQKDNNNPTHTHSGIISGVIYVSNPENIPTIFNNNFYYKGKPGEILLFPSNLKHSVPKQLTNDERITLSFNLE